MNQGDLKRKNFQGRSLDGPEDVSRDSKVENFDQNDCGGVEVEAPSVKKHNSSPLETTTEVLPASFDFYVFEKEGINLHVDLNSSPSDYWNGRIKNELSRGENVRRIGSRSLLQDLGFLGDSSSQRRRSILRNTNSDQINDCNGQTNSCTSLEVPKDDLAWFDRQEEDDSSIMSAPLNMVVNVSDSLKKRQLAVSAELTANVADNLKEYQSTAAAELTATMADNLKENQSTASAKLNGNLVDNLKEDQSIASAELTANAADNLKEGQSTPSAELSYGAPNHFVSGSESCAKNESRKMHDLEVTNRRLIKSRRGSVGNFVSDPGLSGHQNSKPANEISEEFTLPSSSFFVNPSVVCPGASVTGSVELQITEVASCDKNASVSLGENDGSMDLVDLKKLVDSSELNLHNDGNNFLSVKEERERGKIVKRRESSKCLQFDDPRKKSGLDSQYRKSKLELHRKRKQVNSKDQRSSGNPCGRILRSMKHIAGEGLPRRSMRLISK